MQTEYNEKCILEFVEDDSTEVAIHNKIQIATKQFEELMQPFEDMGIDDQVSTIGILLKKWFESIYKKNM
jgi:hypothetical protein